MRPIEKQLRQPQRKVYSFNCSHCNIKETSNNLFIIIFYNDNLNIPQDFRKKEEAKCKPSIEQEITKIRDEINEIETKNNMQNYSKSYSLKHHID